VRALTTELFSSSRAPGHVPGERDEASKPDLLVIQSLADQCNPFKPRRPVLRRDPSNQQVVLVLRSAHHLPPFDGADPSAFGLVVKTTVPFLEMALEDKVLAAQPRGDRKRGAFYRCDVRRLTGTVGHQRTTY